MSWATDPSTVDPDEALAEARADVQACRRAIVEGREGAAALHAAEWRFDQALKAADATRTLDLAHMEDVHVTVDDNDGTVVHPEGATPTVDTTEVIPVEETPSSGVSAGQDDTPSGEGSFDREYVEKLRQEAADAARTLDRLGGDAA